MQNQSPMLVMILAEGKSAGEAVGAGLVGQDAFASPAELTIPASLPPGAQGLPVEKLVLQDEPQGPKIQVSKAASLKSAEPSAISTKSLPEGVCPAVQPLLSLPPHTDTPAKELAVEAATAKELPGLMLEQLILTVTFVLTGSTPT
jgi:hypothetical protein